MHLQLHEPDIQLEPPVQPKERAAAIPQQTDRDPKLKTTVTVVETIRVVSSSFSLRKPLNSDTL